MEKLTFEPISREDIHKILRLAKQLNIDRSNLKENLEDAWKDYKNTMLFLKCIMDDKLVGCIAYLDLHQHPTRYELQWLMIDTATQGKGLGVMLTEYAICRLRIDTDAEFIEVTTPRPNLFLRLNFKIIAVPGTNATQLELKLPRD